MKKTSAKYLQYEKIKKAIKLSDSELLGSVLNEISEHPRRLHLYMERALHEREEKMILSLISCSSKEALEKQIVLTVAAAEGYLDAVKACIDKGLSPLEDESAALRLAARRGKTDVVKYLIPLSDPMACGSHAIWLSFLHNHRDTFVALYPVSDLTLIDAAMPTLSSEKEKDRLKDYLARAKSYWDKTAISEVIQCA